ncbi:DUF3135 domain-containing protein [Photobacterium sp. WH77]|uniref:DUF3135 domain-containing protein n=1 Tax=Photobacterium arenosum TaxID=2774143 RepID=A0ABR9BNS6_9GAMM|nr:MULTISPECIES: DUF3135 domain-containing protein [Photobacterium]MBD8513247.1 DUF3135 domain-containing protein [Photobacterium arenosum]MBV7262160.1 DUF3135 domain-containing protein [Photobacterium sp. WH24]MCG2837092.1 DUF3135 domain-containing protein [Photobacterium sp. WH77]MCG2844758.1 DUF3135 domain-containing protein [Photobacterium sp. WH80]MDO6580757.1 DUF3135 domain-containing protein [Photobacterium sp. 2_MG-2023]
MQTLPSFDELKKLAETAPEELEALRLRMSEEIIENASPAMQPRLRAQMSHINQVIARGKNPNHTNMLLRAELQQQLQRFARSLTAPETLTEHEAKVMPFRRQA